MSKSSTSTALDALANILFSEGSSLLHSQSQNLAGRRAESHAPPSTAFGSKYHQIPAAAPSWNHTGHFLDQGRISKSLVQSGADGQDPIASDWVANEGAWLAFAVPTPPAVSLHDGSSQLSPPSPPTPENIFDPWASSSSLTTITDPRPAQREASPSTHPTHRHPLGHDFESVWSRSTHVHHHDDASRIRPLGSRIDDVSESVWDSLTSAPAQPWSWRAEVNTARSVPVSAQEAQVRAERGRARLGLLARQLVLGKGRPSVQSNIGGVVKDASLVARYPSHDHDACADDSEGNGATVSGKERQQLGAKQIM